MDHKASVVSNSPQKKVNSMSKKYRNDLSKIDESAVSADMTVVNEKNEMIARL